MIFLFAGGTFLIFLPLHCLNLQIFSCHPALYYSSCRTVNYIGCVAKNRIKILRSIKFFVRNLHFKQQPQTRNKADFSLSLKKLTQLQIQKQVQHLGYVNENWVLKVKIDVGLVGEKFCYELGDKRS